MIMMMAGRILRRCFNGLYHTVIYGVITFSLVFSVVYFTYKDLCTGESSTRESVIYLTQQVSRLKDEVQHDDAYRARLQRYQDVCAVQQNRSSSRPHVYYYPNPSNASISFCFVPKTGCTFWAKTLQYLNRTSDSRRVASPFDIARFEVYYHPLVKLHRVDYRHKIMADAVRFFFVRDPFARLMSAYVDKFLLPQFLIYRRFIHRIARLKENFSVPGNYCLTEKVTFKEFIKGIVFFPEWNVHWGPMHTVCDPCKLFPHFIGRQETFSKDAKYILSKVGLGHLMTSYSRKSYITDEIKEMVDLTYSYRDWNSHLRKCYDNLVIAERIWEAFQINGYIATGTEFPKEDLRRLFSNARNTSTVKTVVTDIIERENARAGISRDQHSKRKRVMMQKLYRTLSEASLEKLANMYDADFRMFGYEKYPKDLFPWKHV